MSKQKLNGDGTSWHTTLTNVTVFRNKTHPYKRNNSNDY